MANEHELNDRDEYVKHLLSTLTLDQVLRHFKPEDILRQCKPEDILQHILRHYGLDRLLDHLRNRAPAEHAEAEGKPPGDERVSVVLVLPQLRQRDFVVPHMTALRPRS